MTSCNKEIRKSKCPCTYCDENGKSCVHKGKCCACVAHHRQKNELPACYFSPAQEKTYDRSISHYWHGNGYCHCETNKSFVNKEELPIMKKTIDKIAERHENA